MADLYELYCDHVIACGECHGGTSVEPCADGQDLYDTYRRSAVSNED